MTDYQYTKPRGPIGGMFKSPGPVYQLPTLCGYVNHDGRSTHARNPAWQMGIKHGKLQDDCSPGPVHYPDVRVTRQGKDGTPHYSLYSRHADLKAMRSVAPPPGTYSPEKSGPSASPRAPAYSMGSRSHYRSKDEVPGPNSYSLPTLLGKTREAGKTQRPIYSMTGRSKIGGFSEDLQKTPGPGTYGCTDPNTYQKKEPSYTLRARTNMPADSTVKPGPGAHSPERVKANKGAAPSYSFGIRHSEFTAPLIIDVD